MDHEGADRSAVAFGAPPAVALRPDACGKSHTSWTDAPWNILPRGSREIRAGLAVHRSVVDRLAGVGRLPAPYRPSNLPDYFDGNQIKASVPIVD